MAIAVDPTSMIDYVLKEERHLPVELRTVFKLKNLSARELARIEDGASAIDFNGVMQVKSGSRDLEILRLGLRGWENLRDRNGIPVPFLEDRGVPSDANFDRLRPEWRRELANAITEQPRLSEDERKNSESGRD